MIETIYKVTNKDEYESLLYGLLHSDFKWKAGAEQKAEDLTFPCLVYITVDMKIYIINKEEARIINELSRVYRK